MNNQITTRKPLGGALLLLAMLLPILAATPAQADHERRRGGEVCLHGQCGVGCPHAHTGTRCNARPSVDIDCLDSYERREYIDGFVKGDRRGRAIGWEDGIHHQRYNPRVRRGFHNRSALYEYGYRDAFADAYDYGWHKAHRIHGRRYGDRQYDDRFHDDWRLDGRNQRRRSQGRNRRVERHIGRQYCG